MRCLGRRRATSAPRASTSRRAARWHVSTARRARTVLQAPARLSCARRGPIEARCSERVWLIATRVPQATRAWRGPTPRLRAALAPSQRQTGLASAAHALLASYRPPPARQHASMRQLEAFPQHGRVRPSFAVLAPIPPPQARALARPVRLAASRRRAVPPAAPRVQRAHTASKVRARHLCVRRGRTAARQERQALPIASRALRVQRAPRARRRRSLAALAPSQRAAARPSALRARRVSCRQRPARRTATIALPVATACHARALSSIAALGAMRHGRGMRSACSALPASIKGSMARPHALIARPDRTAALGWQPRRRARRAAIAPHQARHRRATARAALRATLARLPLPPLDGAMPAASARAAAPPARCARRARTSHRAGRRRACRARRALRAWPARRALRAVQQGATAWKVPPCARGAQLARTKSLVGRQAAWRAWLGRTARRAPALPFSARPAPIPASQALRVPMTAPLARPGVTVRLARSHRRSADQAHTRA